MWARTKDDSIIDSAGKLIFMSPERFERDIAHGDCCFICGASPAEKPFNEEHILPEWLLRRYDLFDKTITLPNEAAVRYGGYTVPCCTDCNDLMGDVFEVPISEAVRGGSDSLRELVASDPLKVYSWLGLIYFKTHLRDRAFRFHLDSRKGREQIADGYDWGHLYHVHILVRHFYTNSRVEPEVFGSCLCIPVRHEDLVQRFYYANLYLAQTTLMRLDDIALMAVFDDSGGAMGRLHGRLKRITGPVSEVQARELMVELAFLNLHIAERPDFETHIDLAREESRIVSHRPKLEFKTFDLKMRGMMLENAVKDFMPLIKLRGRTAEEVAEAMRNGTITFLFDDQGKFIEQSAEF